MDAAIAAAEARPDSTSRRAGDSNRPMERAIRLWCWAAALATLASSVSSLPERTVEH
jgi:hypothetical protein